MLKAVVVKHNIRVYDADMVESPSPEEIRKKPIGDLIADVFERRVTAARVRKESGRRLIIETSIDRFENIISALPPEKRDNLAIQVQKVINAVGAYFNEYGERFSDFVRNVVSWPMIVGSKDYPKDKFYQIGLARAAAWGQFGSNTTKTATGERMNYRDHFLPTAVTGAGYGTMVGAVVGVSGLGAEVGLVSGGIQGALLGAAAGGIIGGAYAVALKIKDSIMGPPAVYYDLNDFSGSGGGSLLNIKWSNVSAPTPSA